MGSGAAGMYETAMVAILVSAMGALIRAYGGFDALLYGVKKVFRGRKGGQLGMGLLVGAMDVATANTVAIVMANPIAKEMAQDYGISARKAASLLDTFSCIFQGILPTGPRCWWLCRRPVSWGSPVRVSDHPLPLLSLPALGELPPVHLRLPRRGTGPAVTSLPGKTLRYEKKTIRKQVHTMEQVLVVNRQALEAKLGGQVWVTDHLDDLRQFILDHHTFLPRQQAEYDATVRQIIPYGILRRGGNTSSSAY